MRAHSVSSVFSLLALVETSLCFPDALLDSPAAPAITTPPSPHAVVRALRARQNNPQQTCGWISDNPGLPITCTGSSFCAYDDTNSVFGCCGNPSGCQFQTACVDMTEIGRQTDTDTTLYCTQSTAAICNYYENDFFTSFFCDTSNGGFEFGHEATNSNGIGISTATQYSIFTPKTMGTGTSASHAAPSQLGGPANTPGSTNTASPGSSGSPGNSGSNSTTSGANAAGAPLSTGAVAGIAVAATLGGAAVLAAAGFFCWRSRQNKKNRVQPSISQPQLQQPAYTNNMPRPPPPAPGSGVGSNVYANQAVPGVYPPAPMSYVPSPPGSQYPGVTHVQDSPQAAALNPHNLDQHLRNQEWKGIVPNVAQHQTANSHDEEYDGLGHLPELRPQDAAGEPRYDGRASHIYSEAGQTAMHPASEAVWHQRV